MMSQKKIRNSNNVREKSKRPLMKWERSLEKGHGEDEKRDHNTDNNHGKEDRFTRKENKKLGQLAGNDVNKDVVIARHSDKILQHEMIIVRRRKKRNNISTSINPESTDNDTDKDKRKEKTIIK